MVAMAVLGLSCCLSTDAAVYNGNIVSYKQSDGSALELRLYGDEFAGFFETHDGYTVIHDTQNGDFCYAKTVDDGSALVSTGCPVGSIDPATLGVSPHVRITEEAFKRKVDAARARVGETSWERYWRQRKSQSIMNADGQVQLAPPTQTTTGDYVGLTVLVDFSDDAGVVTTSQAADFCNKIGYSENGNNGSVHDYFYENSNHMLNYTNSVVGYYRARYPKTYYNDTSIAVGVRAKELMKEVADYLLANPPDALPALSTDDSGNCRAVNVLYAGPPPTEWTKGLWPHSGNTPTPYDIGGGKSIYNYQMTDMDARGGTALTLGTFCHENGHMLCDYPDLYDYTYMSIGGAGVFCLMNAGADRLNPSQICAYLKYKSGWGAVTYVTSGKTDNSMTKTGNQFYVYGKPGTPTEYFIWENRQKSGRDALLPASGLAVWHVDELGDRDNPSRIPNSIHANYEVTLVQADNQWHFENNLNSGDPDDLFSLEKNATLNESSSPNSQWWDGTGSGLGVTNISSSSDTMTFDVALSGGGASMVVVNPKGGEEWKSGQRYPIVWNSSGITGDVTVDILKDGATTYSLGASSSGTFLWTVPDSAATSSGYQVKISSASPSLSATSASFSISVEMVYATIGSTFTKEELSYASAPSIYVWDGLRKAKAKVTAYKSFTQFVWTAKVPENVYELMLEPKKQTALKVIPYFSIIAPKLSVEIPLNISTKGGNYVVKSWGITGSNKSYKPTIWWAYEDRKKRPRKLSCAVTDCGYDKAMGLEYVVFQFPVNAFEKAGSPKELHIKNAIGENSYWFEW